MLKWDNFRFFKKIFFKIFMSLKNVKYLLKCDYDDYDYCLQFIMVEKVRKLIVN